MGNRLGINWRKFSLDQFKMGMNVELEHKKVTKGNLGMTGLIALDHLEEDPKYYTKLRKMEGR